MLDGAEIRRLLGGAVVECWGSLPRDVQEAIFERAVREQGDKVRFDLATQLHHAHPRTEHD